MFPSEGRFPISNRPVSSKVKKKISPKSQIKIFLNKDDKKIDFPFSRIPQNDFAISNLWI